MSGLNQEKKHPFWDYIKNAAIVFLPVWLIIISLILFLVGYSLEEVKELPGEKLGKLLNGVASATLSGGVFAAILKSLQFTSLFRDELSKVLFADADWLSTLSDLQLRSIWKNVIRASITQVSPSLADKIGDEFLLQMLPRAESFSYSEMSRDTVLEHFDPGSQVLTLTENFDLVIDSHDPLKTIDYKFELDGEWPSILEAFPYLVESLLIDGVDHRDKIQVTGQRGDEKVKVVYSIPLSGKSSYKVFRRMTRKTRIHSDPIQQIIATRYMNAMTITVQNRVADLVSILAVPIAMGDDAAEPAQVGANIQRWHVSHLVFPGQGLLFLLSPCVAPLQKAVEPA